MLGRPGITPYYLAVRAHAAHKDREHRNGTVTARHLWKADFGQIAQCEINFLQGKWIEHIIGIEVRDVLAACLPYAQIAQRMSPIEGIKGRIKGTLPLFFQALRADQLKFDFSFSARIQAGIIRRPISVVKKCPITHVLPDSTPSPTRNTSTTRACCRPRVRASPGGRRAFNTEIRNILRKRGRSRPRNI